VHRNVRVEIDTAAIAQNVKNVVSTFDTYDYYIGVVKGNAYGHGMGIVKTFIENGINYIGVSTLDEALEVRALHPDIPILCIQPLDLEYLSLCLENNITITLSNYNYGKQLLDLLALAKNEKHTLKVHLKLNTGFNRLGISSKEQFEELYDALMAHSSIELEGLFTHLATAGVLDSIYDEQIARFGELTHTRDISKIKIVHIARSSTLEFHDKIEGVNGVRVGLLLYGINQTFRDYRGLKGKLRSLKDARIKKKLALSPTRASSELRLKTGFALKSGIIEINPIKQGELVGYGGGARAGKDGFVAVCPLGYSDGLSLKYQGSDVLINNKRYPILGVINMCLITILVDEQVSLADEMTLLGEGIGLKETARKLEVTPYVAMSSIAKDIPRVYVKHSSDDSIAGSTNRISSDCTKEQ